MSKEITCSCRKLTGKAVGLPSYMSELNVWDIMGWGDRYTCESCSVRDEKTGEF